MRLVARLALLALALALASAGCAVLGEGPGHVGGRATLSDAAGATQPDTSRKQRRHPKSQPPLDVGYTVPPATTTSVGVTSLDEGHPDSGPPQGASPSGPRDASHGFFGLIAGGGSIGGTDYDGFGEFGLGLGFDIPGGWRADVLGTVSPIQFSNETIAGQSFRNEVDLNLDLAVRFNLTAAHTLMGAYPVGGIRFGTLFWNYNRPVTILEDDVPVIVKDDHINHFSVYGGFGVSPIRARHFQIGAQVLAGSRFYSGTSHRGFSNTLFAPAGFMQVRFETGYAF